jgi:hypothetical protein
VDPTIIDNLKNIKDLDATIDTYFAPGTHSFLLIYLVESSFIFLPCPFERGPCVASLNGNHNHVFVGWLQPTPRPRVLERCNTTATITSTSCLMPTLRSSCRPEVRVPCRVVCLACALRLTHTHALPSVCQQSPTSHQPQSLPTVARTADGSALSLLLFLARVCSS